MPEETEKYGVEEEDNKVKTATEGARKCPSCGRDLRPRDVTGVALCGSCGSKPFEAEGTEPDARKK